MRIIGVKGSGGDLGTLIEQGLAVLPLLQGLCALVVGPIGSSRTACAALLVARAGPSELRPGRPPRPLPWPPR
ncbi:hypothetical protein [Agromyces bauzanensis]|uniref:hypothetical protein n=1 Tax=Agromyces bauzanensis TaxID=1308924 RepID=UPI00166CEEAE|nr:hypothetical protein [Agromyces bauzanensis]